MIPRLLILACLLSPSLLACSSGTGDIPGPGCTSVQSTHELTFSPPMAAGSGEAMQCLERTPNVDSATGAASCVALHASRAGGSSCSCPADQGLQPVSAEHASAVGKFFDATTGTEVTASCVCEITQLTASNLSGLQACRFNPKNPVVDMANQPVNGFCVVDPDEDIGSKVVVSNCASTQRQGIRFVGRPATQEADDISVVLICEAEDCSATQE